jgi:quercetin dioxygenase-like cupin family protein
VSNDRTNDTQRDTQAYGGQHHEAGFWVQPEEVAVDRAALDYEPAVYDVATLPGFDPAPGIRMSVMSGKAVMANWVKIEPGVEVPLHSHPHEQLGCVLEGEITMVIAGEPRTLRPGHAYRIPGNLPHSATAGPAGCLVLDIFSPLREEYVAAAK